MPRRESIKTIIREIREWHGLSQDELGRATGLGSYRILRIERGLYKPTGEEVFKIFQVLWFGELKQEATGEKTPTQANQ